MPLTTNKELLTLARKGGYAVGDNVQDIVHRNNGHDIVQ
jgi:hypothetical protein